jgi:hypothetical protein
MQRISSVLCALAMSMAAFGASMPAQALPLIFDEDPEIAAEAEAARKRSVNILDTSGSSNVGFHALQTLRELQQRRPGFAFSNQPGLADGGGRMGVGNKGGPRGNLSEAENAALGQGAGYAELGTGLFGSGLNAEAVARERVPDRVSDDAAGVRQRPAAYVDPDSNDGGAGQGAPSGSYSVSGDSDGRPLEQKPGFMSLLLKIIREYRVTVIALALMLLLIAVGASVATRR